LKKRRKIIIKKNPKDQLRYLLMYSARILERQLGMKAMIRTYGVVVLSESYVFPNLAETIMQVRFLRILCMNSF
jgi:hypothetical protein